MSRLLAVIVFSVTILVAGVPHGLAQTLSSPETDTELQLPPLSPSGFTLADYRKLREQDAETAQLVLVAMREAIFYAQESVGKSVLCASPTPIPGPRLMAMFDNEISAPTNPSKRPYGDLDHAAFVLMYALKSEDACQ